MSHSFFVRTHYLGIYPANKVQKLIRNGKVHILSDTKTYSVVSGTGWQNPDKTPTKPLSDPYLTLIKVRFTPMGELKLKKTKKLPSSASISNDWCGGTKTECDFLPYTCGKTRFLDKSLAYILFFS